MSVVLLAARECVKESDYTSFLYPIHGKPCISWVIDSIYNNENCVIVINKNNIKLIDYIEKCYKDVNIVIIDEDEEIKKFGKFSILSSLYAGISGIDDKIIKINFGDTLCQDIPENDDDFILTSSKISSSERWTIVKENNGVLSAIYDKIYGLDISNLKAFVGYMQFTKVDELKSIVEELLINKKTSIADLLNIYNSQYPLLCFDCKSWFDFGHKDGLIKAQNSFYNSRDFNSLRTDPIHSIIIKTSSNIQKLRDEYDWYKNLPDELQFLVPRVASFTYGVNTASLEMEMYGYPPLSELFILGNLDIEEWQLIIRRLFEVHKLFENYKGTLSEDNFYNLYYCKTWKRYEKLKNQNSCWNEITSFEELNINGKIYKNINFYFNEINSFIQNIISHVDTTIIHGDYCLSNILFDTNAQICKLIDPRGRMNKQTIYGDPRYDIAKLRHSIVGNYDFIVHGLFKIHHDKNVFLFEKGNIQYQKKLNKIFDSIVIEFGFNVKEIKFIEALLFLSMIPLHSDDINRQKMFYITAVKKFNDFFEEEE